MGSYRESHRIHRIIEGWIPPGSRVLDLGCGDGSLLSGLALRRQVRGIGVEISQDMMVRCLAKGLSVFQADIDQGLCQWDDQSFDYVILNATLQVIHKPLEIMEEMLRVGRSAVVSVSNFGFIVNRVRVLFDGRISRDVRVSGGWHNTPVIRFVSLREFRRSLLDMGISIVDARLFLPLGHVTASVPFLENLLAEEAVFLLRRNA